MFQCRYMTGIPTPVITWTREDGSQLPPNVEVLSGGVLRYLSSVQCEFSESKIYYTTTNYILDRQLGLGESRSLTKEFDN